MDIRSARFFLYLSVSLVTLALALPAAAQSHGGGRGGGAGVHASFGHRDSGRSGRGGARGGGGWQRGGPGWWGVGLGLGLGWGAYYYYNAPYGGYPGYYAPYDPQVVVEQAPQYQDQPSMPPQDGVAPPNTQGAASWYYCDSSRTYYPYSKQCAEGWRAVPVTPPGAGH